MLGVAVALAVAPGRADASVPPTETCDEESYVWTGSATLVDTAPIDTGIVVAPEVGTTLRVVGTSADGLDAAGTATNLTLSVGDAPASPGAVVAGGAVRIHGPGTPVTVNGATLVVSRCSLVAVAAVPELPPGVLPETGIGSTFLLGSIATLVTAIGCACLYAPRRPPQADFLRPTARGRVPGSPPAAPPPAPR